MVDAVSRRRFLKSAVSITTVSYLCGGNPVSGQGDVPSVSGSGWQSEGIENLAKSPHAKLHQVPVRAVTINGGFWGRRRQANVAKSIPSMHDHLGGNGRIHDFPRF